MSVPTGSAQKLDGIAIASQLYPQIAATATQLPRPPGLAVILVGEDSASHIYVRNKVRACERCGFVSQEHRLPATVSQEEVLRLIEQLNNDNHIDGILLQLPLPVSLESSRCIAAIAPNKDVDGLHPHNMGALFLGQPQFVPCTPRGVMVLLSYTGLALWGARAVVVGASNIVGKPLAHMLLQAGVTVTLCNSKTRDVAAHTREADIVVATLGRENFITADMVQRGAVVIDVGINRRSDGTLCGDVAPEVATRAAWLTPVPGGVGPMTIAMLMENTLLAAQQHLGVLP